MGNTLQLQPFSGRRFRLWYWLAWLDLAGFYTIVFYITGEDTVPDAAVGALTYVAPMALLGLAALAAFRRLDWSGGRRARFVLTHLALSFGYGIVITATNYVISAVMRRLRDEPWFGEDFTLRYAPWEVLMGMLIYCVLAGVCYAILLHARLREQEARALRATALQTEAELRALRAQLNPHFLFNTLHSLLSLVRSDARAAEEGLEQFGDLLRYTLDTQKNGEEVPFREELGFVQNYLALEALRLGERLRVDLDVDEAALDVEVPAFCLQPLVENSIRHAIAPRIDGGRLGVRVVRERRRLRLEVTDDGPGASSDAVENANGLGLRLVRERLAACYGAAASFEVDSRTGEGFRVTVGIPIEEEDS